MYNLLYNGGIYIYVLYIYTHIYNFLSNGGGGLVIYMYSTWFYCSALFVKFSLMMKIDYTIEKEIWRKKDFSQFNHTQLSIGLQKIPQKSS